MVVLIMMSGLRSTKKIGKHNIMLLKNNCGIKEFIDKRLLKMKLTVKKQESQLKDIF